MVVNNNFADSILLTGNSGTVTGTNVGSTGETGEPSQSGTLNSVWWSWTAPNDGRVVFDTHGSNYDAYLSVFTGDALDTLNTISQDDDSGFDLQSLINTSVKAGTTYHIAVDGYDGSKGDITLNYNFNTAPTVTKDIPRQTFLVGESFDFQFAEDTFNDLDEDDSLTYSASLVGENRSSWLNFDGSTRTFSSSSTPDVNQLGIYNVEVIASDGETSASEIFQIVVKDNEIDVDGSTIDLDPSLADRIINGGENDDVINGGRELDFISGGAGKDTILGGQGDDTLLGEQGDDFLIGLTDNDLIKGGEDDDYLVGYHDDDLIVGNAGDDLILGNQGDDILYGNTGNDFLSGGTKNDLLFGGAGNDTLWGKEGSDLFFIEPNQEQDIIGDFTQGEDLIGLARGVTFDDLSILGEGDAEIIDRNNNTLAVLSGVSANLISVDDFITL